MAQTKTAFDERPLEVQELTQVIKTDLAKLNAQISDLQGQQRLRKAGSYAVGTNRSAEEHSSQVVVSLQTRLKDAGVSFTNVLESRSQSLRAQKDRREQFSATNIMMPCRFDSPLPPMLMLLYPSVVPPSQVSRQRAPRSPDREATPSHVSIEMPAAQSGGLQQLQLMSTASDTAYLEGRSVALQGIEATINELGTIYQQLATMISEQGETVQRIDMNIENMHYNIERGQSELTKYLRSISSNRWLMIKLFAILIVFIIFWSVFLL